MLLQIGKQKPKNLEEGGRVRKGRSRWSAPIDFTVPTCLIDRPRTGAVATTFHFAFTHVKRMAAPTIGNVPLDPADTQKQAALDHSIYIERDGAAELFEGTKHAVYIEREGSVESVQPAASDGALEQRIPPHVDNDKQTAAEEFGLDEDGIAPATLAVFSNISDDPFERQEYWRAIERTEREPKSHNLTFNPEVCDEWWSSIKHAEGLDSDLTAHLLSVLEEYRRHVEMVAAGAVLGAFYAPVFPGPKPAYRLDAERAGRLLEQARNVPGYDPSMPPIGFKSGRGGRTQYRFVAGLPCEISAEDRAFIVQEFCGKLEALELRTDDNGFERPVGMMYTAVIHAPDRHNDERNYHLHIVAHDRPAKYMPEFDRWDFEVEERYRSHRKWRVRYPHRQNKIGAICRAGNGADYNRSGKGFVSAMRRDYADIVNKVLEARGVERRYDPRSFADIGLELTPTEHLGTRAAALEAIGVVTTVGRRNANIIWNDAERGIERQIEGLQRGYEARQDVIEALLREASSNDVQDPVLEQTCTLASERGALISQIVDHQRAIKIFDHREAKAKSRAKRTLRTCQAYLDDIESGAADKSIVAKKSTVHLRLYQAQQHLDSIDEALASHLDELDRARRTLQENKERLASIDKLIEPLMADVSELTNMAANERKQNDAALREAQQARIANKDRSVATEMIAAQTAVSVAQLNNLGNEASMGIDALPVRKASEKIDSAALDHGYEEIERLLPTKTPIETSKDEAPAERSLDQNPPTKSSVKPRKTVAVSDAVTTPEVSTAVKKPEVEKSRSVGGRSECGEPAKPRKTKMGAKGAAVHGERVDESWTPPRRVEPCQAAGKVIHYQDQPKKSDHESWDGVLDWIRRDRIPIEVRETHSGKPAYHVPSLSEADREILKLRRFSHRTQPRLEEIYKRQQLERVRLGQWIRINARDADKIKIQDGKVELGNVRPAVKTLMRNWGNHPDIQQAFSDADPELTRARNEAQAEGARGGAPAQTTREENRDSRARLREEAEAIYPHPDKVATKAVAKYTQLLRNLASEEELREAAHEVFSSTRARSDVHQYGTELSKAYRAHSTGLPPSLLRQDREIRTVE